MKKIFILLLTLVTLSIITSCDSDLENEISSSNTDELFSFQEDTIETTQLFKDFYEEYYFEIDTITFNEFLSASQNSKYTVEFTSPSDEDLGMVKVKGSDGSFVYAYFYPNASDKETLTSLTYSDGTKEITISDEFHLGFSVTTFDPDRVEAKELVSGLSRQKEFMFEE